MKITTKENKRKIYWVRSMLVALVVMVLTPQAIKLVSIKDAEPVLSQAPNFDIEKSPAADRDLQGVTLDFSYKLHIPSNWWDGVEVNPPYEKLMVALHGQDVWADDRLPSHIKALGIDGTLKPIGSPLGRKSNKLDGTIKQLLLDIKPKVFLEVGVFNGSTSTKVARFFKETPGFENSYVISMDTWILDVAFQRGGVKSVQDTNTKYFAGDRISGGSMMYYQFMANCLEADAADRIIPLPTATSNGAYTLLSHAVRPDFIYIDASHANPDVFIDYENFYNILKPGGLMAADDIGIPAVKESYNFLIKRYNLKSVKMNDSQAYFIKP